MPEPAHVGLTTFPRPATPYETYMAEEGIPIHRGLSGYSDVRQLDLGDWKRLGGAGAFIELEGIGNIQGTFLLGIAAGQRLEPERHMFEELLFVVEGSGRTEVWTEDAEPDIVEWRPNSVFTVPLNAWHRHVAGSDGDALLLAGTNAPIWMQVAQSRDFIFGSDFVFEDRYRPGAGYYTPTPLKEHPVNKRAFNSDAFIPDVTSVEIPLDGQRGAGYHHFELQMGGNFYDGWVGEYPPGRYSKAHAHESGAILVCLNGAGYTLAWQKALGIRPWESGHGDDVIRTEYGPGGIVSAAPGGADWFHAHFGASREPFRAMALSGGFPKRVSGKPGDDAVENQDLRQGGDTIGYADEDPMIRRMFKETLESVGAKYDMPDELYEHEHERELTGQTSAR
jgi:mannose-6-phosphate isomerase-like protein (cupin superfamily)